ncbi:hypothetical protein DFH11DRAFT_1745093 [Phellopilus nigrolimitatus]|nr:hypothetical protein DFH11DRAFT_1745093 [Phellopilus nigrolimitatus]
MLDVVHGAREVETQQMPRVAREQRKKQREEVALTLSFVDASTSTDGIGEPGPPSAAGTGVALLMRVTGGMARWCRGAGGGEWGCGGCCCYSCYCSCRRARVLRVRTAGGGEYGALGAGECRTVEMESSCASAAFASVTPAAVEPQHRTRARRGKEMHTTHADNAERAPATRSAVCCIGGAEHVRFGRRGGDEVVKVGEGGVGQVDVDGGLHGRRQLGAG